VVSGSGPTCAFLVRDAEHGLDVAVGLTSAQVAADVRRVRGPVPGARIVG
jgi:4-diphosphocytidyl-2-C-methyl-D-erythritol kinase